jgi:multiple sugar transport system substrate-binding protein
MIYYSKETFAKEGLKAADIPAKWDDFIKLAQQLTQKDANGKVTRSGCVMNDYWQHEYLWHDLIYQQGGWVYNEDGTKALWEEEPSVKAVEFIRDWYLKHQIDSLELPVGYGSFGNGLGAMMLGSGWNTGFMLNDFPQMKDQFDTVPMPTYTGKMTPSTGLASPEETFQVFTNFPAETQEAGFEFAKFTVAGEDNAVRWGIDEQIVPDVKSLINDPRLVDLPSLKGQLPGMPYRVTTGERPIEAEKLWRAMFDEVLLKGTDPKAALKVATDAINIELPKKKRYITERNYKPPA